MILLKKIKNAIDFVLNKLSIIVYLPELLSRKGHVYVSYAIPRWKKNNVNFGDDINAVLVEFFSGKKVIPYQFAWFPQKHFLCIGSVLQWYSSPNAVVWGTGMLQKDFVKKPKKIYAVRGPKTREVLLKQGIECPMVYGDPALLLPYIYKPKLEKKYKISIVPHAVERSFFDNKKDSCNGAHFIDIVHYGSWKNFIDEICSSEVVLTSSLHAVIVADAYGIPNLWCQFSDYIANEDCFKFHDYFASVGKNIIKPYELKVLSLDIAKEVTLRTWCPPKIDLSLLLKNSPFSH